VTEDYVILYTGSLTSRLELGPILRIKLPQFLVSW